MEMPDNIFAFEEGLTLFIFVAYGHFSEQRFADFADKASYAFIPERVAVVYQQGIVTPAQLDEVKRHISSRFRRDALCFCFDEEGNFGTSDPLITEFLEMGKARILRKRNPVLLPPPGKAFVKPSGKRDGFFLHASNLFVRHAEMSFLALLLIREWDGLLNEKILTIYVDTIDLYGLTSLACRMRFGKLSHGPITVSYSSYTAYKKVLKRVDVRSSLMVISATTSHGLLKDIIKKTRWKDADRVVTILGLDPLTQKLHANQEAGDQYKVIAVVKPEGAPTHLDHLPSLRLGGEKFTLESEEPKSVILNKDNHGKCLNALRVPDLIKTRGLLAGFAKLGTARAPLWINTGKLFASKSFREWLRERLERFAPISTTHFVVAQEAMDTKGIIEDIQLICRDWIENGVRLITADDLSAKSLVIKGSVVVICPCFSAGTKLLEVSRDLRRQRKLKNIVYFTGIGTPISTQTLRHLRQDLETDGYKMHSFCQICTGSAQSLALSWTEELRLLTVEPQQPTALPLVARRSLLQNGDLRDGDLFYRGDLLKLHKGFKFWEGVKYSTKTPPALMLLATIAAVLQNARTDSSLPEKDRLSPMHNRRVLLDPENFFRYNDSLIQATLLRAALPSEIDYSDNEGHSSSMVFLLHRAEQVGDSALVYELLLALVTKRLRLTRSKLQEVKETLSKSRLEECQWFLRTEAFRNLLS